MLRVASERRPGARLTTRAIAHGVEQERRREELLERDDSNTRRGDDDVPEGERSPARHRPDLAMLAAGHRDAIDTLLRFRGRRAAAVRAHLLHRNAPEIGQAAACTQRERRYGEQDRRPAECGASSSGDDASSHLTITVGPAGTIVKR